MDFAQYLHPTYGNLQIPIDQFPVKNTGILEGSRPTDWVSGVIPYQIVLPNYDWRPFVVLGEKQWYPNFDSMGCTGYSNNNLAEIQLKQSTNYEFNFSDEEINFLAGCTQEGNYLYKPADVAKNIGRILQKDWTILNPKTWKDLQKPIPQDVLNRVIKFNENYEWIGTDKASLIYHLKQAPIQIIINNATHAVVLVHVNDQGYWYFDSYDPYLKLTTVQPSSALKIVVKFMNQTKVVKAKNSQTLWECTPIPDIGFDNYKKLANVRGIIVPDVIPDSDSLT